MLRLLRNSTIRNMKKLFFLLATLAITVSAVAQDIIVTKEPKKIEAKITEVSKSEIKYKKFDYQDGPTFILSTDDIVTIIYANGEVVLYNDEVQKEKEAVAKANAMGSLFGNTGTEGGHVGQPIGRGQGNAWGLSGRSLVGTLPQPSNNFKQEGKVVVQIRVNAAGDVVEATVTGGNIDDRQTQQIALDAAKKAKFTKGDHDQIGTITYIFKLN